MDFSPERVEEYAKGKPSITESTRQRAHLRCSDIELYFPEHADLFRRNQQAREYLDRAIAEREIVLHKFNETVKMLVARSRPAPRSKVCP